MHWCSACGPTGQAPDRSLMRASKAGATLGAIAPGLVQPLAATTGAAFCEFRQCAQALSHSSQWCGAVRGVASDRIDRWPERVCHCESLVRGLRPITRCARCPRDGFRDARHRWRAAGVAHQRCNCSRVKRVRARPCRCRAFEMVLVAQYPGHGALLRGGIDGVMRMMSASAFGNQASPCALTSLGNTRARGIVWVLQRLPLKGPRRGPGRPLQWHVGHPPVREPAALNWQQLGVWRTCVPHPSRGPPLAAWKSRWQVGGTIQLRHTERNAHAILRALRHHQHPGPGIATRISAASWCMLRFSLIVAACKRAWRRVRALVEWPRIAQRRHGNEP